MAEAERTLMKRALEEAQAAVNVGAERMRQKALRNPPSPAAPDVPQMTVAHQDVPYASPGPNMDIGGLTPEEHWIIQRESSGKTTAKNPKSSAFGLGQLLKGNREKYGKALGIDPNTTDRGEQLQMFRSYITERYGTAAKAKAFWEKHGWY